MEQCKPTPIEPESKYHSADYNCNSCDNKECEHWADYNEVCEGIDCVGCLKDCNLIRGVK